MRKLALQGLTALVFGVATVYFAIIAAVTSTSEQCILTASAAFLCLTLCLALVPDATSIQSLRRARSAQRMAGLS